MEQDLKLLLFEDYKDTLLVEASESVLRLILNMPFLSLEVLPLLQWEKTISRTLTHLK